MGLIFISHSWQNNNAALEMRQWLKDQGWDRVFLDLDPEAGFAPGQNWRRELQRAGHECEAVILLISPDWCASKWCVVEYMLARQLGKPIFPVFIAATPHSELPAELISEFQYTDLSDQAHREDGLTRLAVGLHKAGLEPGGFRWPPPGDPGRLPYRGLEAYEMSDAGIYFGRQDAIAEVLTSMRTPDDGACRLYIVLGASGSGKSSFLKTGLLSRLTRSPEEFLVFPVIRPSDGLPDIHRMLDDAVSIVEKEAHTGKARRRILAIDQAEEIFQHPPDIVATFLTQLASTLSGLPTTYAIMTIRSDLFAELQAAPEISGVRKILIDLAPVPPHAWPELIQRPAEVSGHPDMFSAQLVEGIINDYQRSETLPLLSYMLKHLYVVGLTGQKLDLAYYKQTGGLDAILERQTSAAIRKWRTTTGGDADILRALSQLFVPWLISIDDETGALRRRVASWTDIPHEQHGLAEILIAERLLVSTFSPRNGRTLEVIHEALFDVWPTLNHVIALNQQNMRQSKKLLSDVLRWENNNNVVSDLAHKGNRLKEAIALLDEAPSLFAKQEERVSAYLWECWRHDGNFMRRAKYLMLFLWVIFFFVNFKLR